jgi:DNA repair exonuclease SbcCD nuclease subunit
MKILRVGDPHVKVSNLEEWEKLAHHIVDVALKTNPDRIEILGDLMHTHAVIRLEVLDFWNDWLDCLSEGRELFVLVGNHDLSGDYNVNCSALSVFQRLKKKNLHIIENPQNHGSFGYMPYYHDHQKFVEHANNLATGGCKVLVCHQTFSGSHYENSFYDPNGINSDLLNFDTIISGHIHARQRFGKVIYPGTAMWDSSADCNQPKGLWLVEHDASGRIIKEEFLDTSSICTQYVEITYNEGDKEPEIPQNSKVSLIMRGTSEWVNREKEKFKGRVNLKTKYTDTKKVETRKVGKGFEDYLSNVFPSTMDRTALLDLAKELNVV